MCSVCRATEVIDASAHPGPIRHATFGWEGRAERVDISSEGVTNAEFTSGGTLRVRRTGDADWSEAISTSDLAGSVGALGVDVKWPYVHPTVQAWLAGGDFAPVHARLLLYATEGERPVKARRASLVEWRKKQSEHAKTRLQNILKLPAFRPFTWSLAPTSIGWNARSGGGLHLSISSYNARGTVKRTRITLHAPLSVEGPAESVGRVIQLLDMEREIQQRTDDMEAYIRQQRGLPPRPE